MLISPYKILFLLEVQPKGIPCDVSSKLCSHFSLHFRFSVSASVYRQHVHIWLLLKWHISQCWLCVRPDDLKVSF